MSMEDILKALVDSRQQGGTSQPQQGADPMTSLIGGLLGGVQQQTGNSQQGADMANLIGGLLGGNQSQSQSGGHAPTPPSGYVPQQYSSQPQGGAQSGGGLGDLMGLLEGFMGGQGGQGSTSQNDPIMALLQPFITPLAKKANISPAIAAVVVSFLVHKLLAHHPTSGRDSNSFNLDEMLGQMSTGKVDTSLLHNSGMVRELSQKTGMNEQATEAALQAAIPLIGNTVSKFVKPSGAAHAPVKPSSAGTQAKAVKKPAAKK